MVRPLQRCALDPRACAASGHFVAVAATTRVIDCPTCGRRLRVSPRPLRGSDEMAARIPSHRDPTAAAEERATRRSVCEGREAVKQARAGARRGAVRIVRSAAARVARMKPPATNAQIRKLRASLAQAEHERWKRRALAFPHDPRRIVRALLEASAIDAGAIEPDKFWEHIAGVLPQGVALRLTKLRPTEIVGEGLVALVRSARPRSWRDLEEKSFAGQRSLLDFAREFEGLESLHLPDHVIDALSAEDFDARELEDSDIPF